MSIKYAAYVRCANGAKVQIAASACYDRFFWSRQAAIRGIHQAVRSANDDNIHGATSAYVVALDPQTGKERDTFTFDL